MPRAFVGGIAEADSLQQEGSRICTCLLIIDGRSAVPNEIIWLGVRGEDGKSSRPAGPGLRIWMNKYILILAGSFAEFRGRLNYPSFFD